MELSSHTFNDKNKTNIIGSDTFNLCNDLPETETLLTKKRKKIGRPRKPYSLTKHPHDKEKELEIFALEIAGGKEEALLLLQKVQQKLVPDQKFSNQLLNKIAENLQFIFKQFATHDLRRSALANLIFRESLSLQKVKQLTGVSKSAMSRRNQLSKEHLFSIIFSKVGYL
jgi:hypothetical protein